MKKVLFFSLALAAFAGCQVNELAPEYSESALPEAKMTNIYVGMESDVETRTSTNESMHTLWSKGDMLNFFCGINNTKKDKYILDDECAGDKFGVFYGPIYAGAEDMTQMHQPVLVYPFSETVTCEQTEAGFAIAGVVIPAQQNFVAGTYANGAHPMVAVGKDNQSINFNMKNTNTALKLSITGPAEKKIDKIVISSKDEYLAGTATITAAYGADPEIKVIPETGSKTVELLCNGVQLSETETVFYVTFAPCNGPIEVKVYDTDGEYFKGTLADTDNNGFARNEHTGKAFTYVPNGSIVGDLVEAFKNGGKYTLYKDVVLNRESGLILAGGNKLDLDLNGYTLTTNCGGTQITVEKSVLRISNGTIKHRKRGQFLFDTKEFDQNSVLELTDVNVECLTSEKGYFLRIFNSGTNVVLNNTNIAASDRIFRWSGENPDQTLPGITINGGKFKAPIIFKDIEGNVPVTFNGGLFSENESYKKGVKWVETGDEAYPWTPVALSTVMMNGVGYNTIQEAINEATTGGEVIAVAEGTYTEILDIKGGKNFTIQPQEGANVTIAGVAHESNGSATTAIFNNITFDNSLQTEGWFTGTAPNIKPCVGAWGGNLAFNDCTFKVAGTSKAETGVMTWWTTEKGSLSFNKCTFNGIENHASARAMQIYGNMDLTVSQCTFNTPYRYSLKYVGDETTAVLTNNTVNNAQYMVELGSSAYPGNAYEVTILGSVLVEGIENFKVANVEEQIVNGVEYSKYPVRANGNKYMTVAEAIAGTTGDVEITVKEGEHELVGFNDRNISIVGEDKEKVTVKMSKSIYMQGASLTLKNVTYYRPRGLGYTEQDFAFIHHAANITLTDCHVEEGIRLNVNEALVENCTFNVPTSSGFDGYGLYYYGNDKSTVTVSNSTFNTAGKAIVVYSEHAKAYNLVVNDCTFKSSNAGTDKAAIQIHAEYGITGTLTVNRCTATGFADINDGLWNELNNNTKVPTDNFYKVIDGVAYVASAANFNKALSQDIEEIKVVLTSDVTVKGGTSTAYGSANTTKVTIEGNENTLTYEDSYRTYIGLANPDAVLVLKDMNLTRSTTGGTHWHDNNMKFECNTQMSNVKFNKGICLDDAKTFNLKNVTVSKDKVSTYAVFVTAGCDATFDGCTFTGTASDRRGIKVADEDVADKTQLTKLTISNSTFNTASKAAVLVTSEGGANVVWGEGNDISNVAADQTNAVWVDEDRPASFDLVTVTGCTKIMEP